MKIDREMILNNFTQKDIDEILFIRDRFLQIINYYKKNDYKSFEKYLELMGEDGQKLMFEGELSDTLIKLNQTNGTACDRTFKREDGTICYDIWQTTFKMKLMKICTEMDTIIYLNNLGLFDIKFNPKSSNIVDKNSHPTSDPDFIFEKNGEKVLIELKTYINREEAKNEMQFKEWQFNNLYRNLVKGASVNILHKYYLKDGKVIYKLYDFKDMISNVWHEDDLPVNKESKIYKHFVFCNTVNPYLEWVENIRNTNTITLTDGKYLVLKSIEKCEVPF